MRLLTFFIALAITFLNIHVADNKAKAAAPLAIPVVAIGTLELMAAGATVALSIGIITTAQNQEFQRQITESIEKIKVATAEVADKILTDTVAMYNKMLGNKNQCFNGAGSSTQVKKCNGPPEECCSDFFKKFADRSEKRSGGFKIFKRAGNRSKVECCMEWDSVHFGYEIFDNLGRHMGERGCDDLSDDPCEWTKSRGTHAQPASSSHRPRSTACSP